MVQLLDTSQQTLKQKKKKINANKSKQKKKRGKKEAK